MTKYSTWERPVAPISPTVRAVAWHFLDVELPDDVPAPVGLLVGEQPGKGHNAQLPLWPYPPQSAGARLYRMAGIPLAEYLTRLARVNMARGPVSMWVGTDAALRATGLLATLPEGTRVVLLGARARAAFGMSREWFKAEDFQHGVRCVAIPHPSGRCREYNDPATRRRAAFYLQWAAQTCLRSSNCVRGAEHAGGCELRYP